MQANVPLWETGDWEPLPALTGEVDADVCVIGLGGSGLACVTALLSTGVRVVGVDAGRVAAGASGRNGGFLRAGLAAFHHEAVARYGRERAVRLYRLTIAERERMVRETPEAVRRTGYLRLAHDADEERDCRAHLAALGGDDLPGYWYDGPEGRGVLIADDAACNPLQRCRLLASRAASAGARLFERSCAVAVAGDRVETEQGRVTCRAVVVAVDGGLVSLLPELSDRVRSARLQMLATAAVEQGAFPFATGTRWGWDYWQQTSSGEVALGGCRDAGGDAEWTGDPAPTHQVQRALEQRLRDTLRVAAPVTHRWAATVSYTEDGLPLAVEARPRVFAIGAYSGTGNLLGAAYGRFAARAALGGRWETPFD
jgi:gamma-glutamylputrescine oxidase